MARFQKLKIKDASGEAKFKSLVSEGIVVAGLTAAIYFLTFVFEYGYCSYFGIPGFFVEPTTGNILFSALIMSFTVAYFISVGQMPVVFFKMIPSATLKVRLVLVAILWTSYFLSVGGFRWSGLVLAILLTFILLHEYMLNLIFTSGTLNERIASADAYIKRSDSGSLTERSKLYKKILAYFMLTYLALVVAFFSGLAHARLQKGFVVLKSSPEFAVIKRYGDRVIAIRYEGSPAKSTGEFRLLDKDNEREFLNLDDLTISSYKN
ncbi:hypothetical protein [Delftia sp. WSY_7]|uniref:hypothetical protein n=1 Tax=Delftia sp. WSY_7 TaxID=3367202 RepID=UPI00370ABACF